MSKSFIVYIGLGSNLGNRLQNLQDALDLVKKQNNVFAISSVYSTPPMGFKADTDFYNAVIGIETKLLPLDLLKFLKKIEQDLGRKKKKTGKYESRTIDLDILDFNSEIYESDELNLPHKEIQFRSFVMLPLLEIAQNWIHPVFNKNLIQLTEQRPANDSIIKLHEKLS